MTDSLIESENNFSRTLINWYEKNKRSLPWRENSDPYRVWLSEIILQQTRVSQGLSYFYQFIENFPSIHDLAAASEDEVLRLWEGLGYYSRARNLHATAKFISYELNGAFPDNYNELLKLKGVGPYTAAAIASICFNESVPVIDGNVYRLIARVFGIYENIADTKTRKKFESVLKEIIPVHFPGSFNQGMMEMGALVCKPGKPDCENCDLREFCYAYQHKKQGELPVKIKQTKVRKREFVYTVWIYDNLVAMKKRPSGDIWQGLYDFSLEEKGQQEVHEPAVGYSTIAQSKIYKHILSHQRIEAVFEVKELENEKAFQKVLENYELSAFSKDEIVTLPKPKLIVNFLNDMSF